MREEEPILEVTVGTAVLASVIAISIVIISVSNHIHKITDTIQQETPKEKQNLQVEDLGDGQYIVKYLLGVGESLKDITATTTQENLGLIERATTAFEKLMTGIKVKGAYLIKFETENPFKPNAILVRIVAETRPSPK